MDFAALVVDEDGATNVGRFGRGLEVMLVDVTELHRRSAGPGEVGQ
jgi:hypothetical protein